MLTVVTWFWRGPARDFAAKHVNLLQRNIARHLTLPHRFVCITDEPADGFAPGVHVVATPPLARGLAKVDTPEGVGFPSCYRRLWLFSKEAAALGGRFLLLDMDCLAVRNIDHIAQRPEPFVGWVPGESAWGGKHRFGGGMYLMTAGAHPEVFDDFTGAASIAAARAAGYRGSDQAWINFKLWGRVARMSHESGIHMWRELRPPHYALPSNAALVQFSGKTKPWTVPWRAEWLKQELKR